MTIVTALHRLRRMGPANCARLAEAAAVLALASFAIKLLPFRTIVNFAGRPVLVRGTGAELRPRIASTRWAVQAVADRVPWRAVCFQRGLALHYMLRRRGIASVLHYGVGNLPDGRLMAHVWLTHGGAFVIGGETAHEYACLASYPAADS